MASLILDDCISDEELQKHREQFIASTKDSTKLPDINTQFQYALCLVRSGNSNNIQNAFQLFKKMFDASTDEDFRRDTLYYMAVAEAKLKNYEPALKYLDTILKVQPNNDQVKELIAEVNKRIKRDGLIGIGIAGSAAFVGFIGLVGLGTALVLGKKK